MKKYFAFAALVLAAAVSCQKETGPAEEMPVAPGREGYVEITLSAKSDVETKAILDGNTVVWSVGEEVAVYPDAATTPEKFTVKAVDFDKVTITGSVPAGTTSLVAVYPYDNAEGRDGNDVTVYIPESQNIPDGGSIDPNALVSAAVYTDLTQTAQFKNLFSIIALNVGATDNATLAGIMANASDAAVAGPVKATLSADAAPVVAPTAKMMGGVELFAASHFAPNSTLYAVVAPGTIDGFTVGVGTDSKLGTVAVAKQLVLERNKGIDLGDVSGKLNWKITEIRTAEELQEFLAVCDTYTADDYVRLGADIDLSGVTIVPAAGWKGTFDGKGYSLKNWTAAITQYKEDAENPDKVTGAACSLFATNDGIIRNLVIDSSCKIDWTDPVPDQTGVSFIVAKANKGLVEGCEVAGSISVETATAGRIFCAGVVGESTTGVVSDCKFSGSISVAFSGTSASCSAISGVVARVGSSKTNTGNVIVSGCENTGSIKFVFSGASGAMKKFGIGGVVGQTVSVEKALNDYGVIENCINRGKIEWEYPAGGSGSYPCLGGVVGIVEGVLRGSSNYGEVSYKGGFSVAATDANIGGVAGYVTLGASDCHNYGEVYVEGAFAGGTSLAQSGGNSNWSSFGGVFGDAGPYAANNTYCADKGVVVENCSNNAPVSFKCYMITSGGPQMCFGGVVGVSTANLKNCVNNGKKFYVETQIATINAGGVVGFLEADMEDCANNGVVILDGAGSSHPALDSKTGKVITEQAYFGGVFGMATKGSVANRLKNTGDVTLMNMYNCGNPANADYNILSYVGGVNGSYKGGITLTDVENTGIILNTADVPLCLGGVSGAFNGIMTGGKNSGQVSNSSTYCSTVSGKQPEVGGIAGYANAVFTNCENTGPIGNVPDGGFSGGLVGSHGEDTSAIHEWVGGKVNCEIFGGATAGSVLGRFRFVPTDASKPTQIDLGSAEAPFYVDGPAASLPLVGTLNNHILNPVAVFVAGKQVVPFTEDLAGNKFTYAGREYPIVKMKDGRWWMASNLAFVPAGMTPSTDLTAVTAGVFAPLKVNDAKSAAEFTTDEAVVTANGYLYQAEVALGLKVGDITSVAQAQALEKAQGICPPGWHVPASDEIMALVGKTSGLTTVTTAPYYDGSNGSIPLLNADGFNMQAYGSISIVDVTRTAGTFMGFMAKYSERLTSGMYCGSSYAGVTYNTSGDEASGIKNLQFYGFMPMTNKDTEAEYTCNGTKVSYRIAAPLRCIRDAE